MALFVQNGQTLLWNGENVQFGGEGIPITVALHQITGSNIEMLPSSSLCFNSIYAIRVVIPDVETDILFLAPDGNGGVDIRPPSEVGGLPSSEGLFGFRTVSSRAGITDPVVLNRPFQGRLGLTSGTYILRTTPNWAEAGYCQSLPIVLNNCVTCGCPDGTRCFNGRCASFPSTNCPPDVPCGYNGGRCSGGCTQNGYSCQNIDGVYRCATTNYRGFNLALFLGIIFFLVLLGILIALAFRSSMKSSPTPSTVVIPSEPAPKTVAIGNTVL
jgi:hypothetical protein